MNVLRTTAALLLAAVAQPAVAEELPARKVLSLGAAKAIAEGAEAHARDNNWNVCIAIVDDAGDLIYFRRMDGTQKGSVVVSMKKAESAARFRRPTKVFEDAVAGGRHAVLTLPGAVPLEGGLPIIVEGQVIGAIGISGVLSSQDGMIAQAGIDALAKFLEN